MCAPVCVSVHACMCTRNVYTVLGIKSRFLCTGGKSLDFSGLKLCVAIAQPALLNSIATRVSQTELLLNTFHSLDNRGAKGLTRLSRICAMEQVSPTAKQHSLASQRRPPPADTPGA